MDRPRSKKEISHDRIVETAARAIRRSGYAGVGVADIMREAGLTHGGFYAHFASRDAMLVEALERAGRESVATIEKGTEKGRRRGVSAFRALLETYLSEAHVSGAEDGCPVAALSSEMPHQSSPVLKASAERVRTLMVHVQSALLASNSKGRARAKAKEQAAVVTSTMVGALQLARTLGANAQGRAVLTAARRELLERYDRD
jgi:AcrR family transcriptional regulator